MHILSLLHAALLGLGTGLALIVAIGAQNAFVLRQGIRGRHVAVVVAVCAASDAVLIAAGVLGMGGLVTAAPVAVVVLRYVGAAFLVVYGILAARRAFKPQFLMPNEDGAEASHAAKKACRSSSRYAAVVTVLALTWLNPHVYLDTVVLLGSVAASQEAGLQWWFGAGAMVGSVAWFSALGFGARLLRGFFARPASWRVLDSLIAATMTALGLGMALGT
jgi:L-lysine exporter family protein LysE/ArgO